MFQWLSKIFGRKPAASKCVDKLVPANEYDFKFGTKSMVPEELRDLKVLWLDDWNLLLFENFNAELHIAQCMTGWDDLDSIVWATQSLRWACKNHKLKTSPQAPVRLHSSNLLLISKGVITSPESQLPIWLDYMQFETNRSFTVEETTTTKPLEDGYFRCVRLMFEESPVETNEIVWKAQKASTESVIEALARFIREESRQPWFDCEKFLLTHYSDASQEQLMHPIFTMIDFGAFCNGSVRMYYAASIVSPNEIRLWSRPMYLHK